MTTGNFCFYLQNRLIQFCHHQQSPMQGITKGGPITVPLTSCFAGLDLSVLKIKTKIVSCHTADSKPVEQEVNSTKILTPLVFPALWCNHRHLRIIDCLTVRTACLVYFISTVNGHSKKRRKEG
jgi:hypothetical protein